MEGSSAQHGGTAVRLWCAVRAEAHRTDRFAYPRSSEQDPDDSVPNRGGDVGDVPDATVERNTGGLSEHASESSDGHSSSARCLAWEGQLIHRSRFNFLREEQIWHNSNAPPPVLSEECEKVIGSATRVFASFLTRRVGAK